MNEYLFQINSFALSNHSLAILFDMTLILSLFTGITHNLFIRLSKL